MTDRNDSRNNKVRPNVKIPDCAISTEIGGCRLGTTTSRTAQGAIRSLVGANETPQSSVAITQSGVKITKWPK